MAKLHFAAFSRFYTELRRRKVFKVAATYAIVGWLVIQVGANTFPALHLPEWSLTLVIVLTVLGLPIALVLAWIVELTPKGIRAEVPAALPNAAAAPQTALVAARNAVIAARPHRPLRGPSDGESATQAAASADPVPQGHLGISQLRHDLRTPMNAILGYCDVLVDEAKELGIEAALPDLRQLHAQAHKLLDRINDAVPAATAGADDDIEALRVRAREMLLEASRALLRHAQEVAPKLADAEQARSDFERLVSAANKLTLQIEGLANRHDGEKEKALTKSVEQTLNRLRPGASPQANSGGTLLVVDDNALNRDLLVRQLVREGYNVQAVGSGREALEVLRLHEFDLILLDVIMPEMDGVELLERIARDGALSGIPVIMMSALDEIGGVARCLEKGAADYLIKPFDPVLLRARIRSTLQIRHLHADLRTLEAQLEHDAAAMARLSHSIAPPAFAPSPERVEQAASVQYPEVTAVVVRMEGVDALAARRPGETAALLTRAFECFDRVSAGKGIDYTRIADHSFTAIAGATTGHEAHAERAAELACELRDVFAAELAAELAPLNLRIGLHTGVLTAGLAGHSRWVFGLWGEAVTTSDAIACCAPLSDVVLSNATSAKLGSRFVLDTPIAVDVPGRGRLPTRRIKERRAEPVAMPGSQASA